MSEEIAQALSLLFPDQGIAELRALADNAVHSGYFDRPEALASHASSLDSLPEVQGIYITLNPVNPALLARRANRVKLRLTRKDATTADADILCRRWLPVDLDPVRPSGVSSTGEEHRAALDRAGQVAAWLAERGFPEPVRADSGNGAHLLYRVNLPNDEASGELVKKCLVTLDAFFSDGTVAVDAANFNPARIWKLYGTTSRKGDHTLERPHRRSRVLAVPDPVGVVSRDQLEQLARALPAGPSPGGAPALRTGNGIDLRAWLSSHGLAVRIERPWQGGTLFVLEECPFSGSHKDGAFAIQFPNGAIFAGCHHQTCGGGAQRWPDLRRQYERSSSPARSGPVPVGPPAALGCFSGTDPAALETYPGLEEAAEVLRTGDPLRTMLDTGGLDHVGDRTVAECLLLSLASRSVINTNGLHVSVTGESGKGKSHVFSTILRQVPERFRLRGAMSNKALFYHDSLQPGTVIILDDTTLSDEMQEILKGVTTSFREPFIYRTVSRDRKGQVCTIPERCVWWVAKVEGSGDDQVFNRMLTCWIDDSPEQDDLVLARVLLRDQDVPAYGDEERPEVLICQAMWEVLGRQRFYVVVPFSSRIRFQARDNRRNPEMLLDLIKANTLFRFMQRETRDVSGVACIVATRDDFREAARLYGLLHGSAGGQTSKLTRREADLLDLISKERWPEFTIPMLQRATGWSNGSIHKLIHGYTSRGMSYSGLLEKCPAIAFTDRTVVSEEESGLSMRRRTNAYTFDQELYQHWIAGGGVWIEEMGPVEGGDPCNPPAPFPGPSPDVAGEDNAPATTTGESLSSTHSTCVSTCVSYCREEDTHQGGAAGACTPAPVSKVSIAEGPEEISPEYRPNDNQGEDISGNRSRPSLKGAEGARRSINPRDYKVLDIPERTPCWVCGRKDSRYIEKFTPERKSRPKDQQGARRICKPCYKAAVDRERSSAPALPGVIDTSKMERVNVSIGRCSVCDLEPAVWKDKESRVRLCEGCYTLNRDLRYHHIYKSNNLR